MFFLRVCERLVELRAEKNAAASTMTAFLSGRRQSRMMSDTFAAAKQLGGDTFLHSSRVKNVLTYCVLVRYADRQRPDSAEPPRAASRSRRHGFGAVRAQVMVRRSPVGQGPNTFRLFRLILSGFRNIQRVSNSRLVVNLSLLMTSRCAR